jgi:hypothetical protein
MSYLTGPLTRGQIKELMDPKRAAFESGAKPAASNPMAMPGVSSAAVTTRPVVGAGVKEKFAPISENHVDAVYCPCLLRIGTVRFYHNKSREELSRSVKSLHPILKDKIGWEVEVPLNFEIEDCLENPVPGIDFNHLPGFAMNISNYKQVEKDFSTDLFAKQRATILYNPETREWSKIDETERDFRIRLFHSAREARDKALEAAREKARVQSEKLKVERNAAENILSRQKVESAGAAFKVGARIFGRNAVDLLKNKWPVLANILGRKSASRTSSTTTINEATQAYKQYGDVKEAKDRVDSIEKKMEKLELDLADDISKIQLSFEQDSLNIESETIKPAKSNIGVEEVCLLWLPQ